jgi:2-iminoacetate synthase ThiH
MSEDEAENRVNFPPHCRVMREAAEKEEEGWREALVSGGDHLKRALDEYVELGFACLLEELDAGEVEGCTECFKTEGERMYRVYVRRV